MNSSNLFVTAVAAVSVVGAATYAYAQTSSTEPGQIQGTQSQAQAQTQGQMQQQATPAFPSSTNRPATEGTTEMRNNSSNNPSNNSSNNSSNSSANAEADRMNQADRAGTPGMGSGTAPMASDGSSSSTERAARADRN